MNQNLKQFPLRTANYLGKLSRNNNREWFEANRDLYVSDFLEPSIAFVSEMGEKLIKLDPDIVIIPKIDKSIFRLHRDVRFSKNKEPYKTNAGLYFWNGKVKKMESSGFYFHIEPKIFGIAGGMHIIPKDQLKPYRDAVSDSVKGKELDVIVKKLEKTGYEVGGKNYKKIPKDYDANSPHAKYLLHDGVYAWYEDKNLKALSEGNVIEFIFKKFKDMLPLHQWFVKNLL